MAECKHIYGVTHSYHNDYYMFIEDGDEEDVFTTLFDYCPNCGIKVNRTGDEEVSAHD